MALEVKDIMNGPGINSMHHAKNTMSVKEMVFKASAQLCQVQWVDKPLDDDWSEVVASGTSLEVVDPSLVVFVLILSLLVASCAALLKCVLMVWSYWDWKMCSLVFIRVVFGVENGARKDLQKHHHSEQRHACLKPALIWSPLSLCARQLPYYCRAYSCFQFNGSTGVSYANLIELYLHILLLGMPTTGECATVQHC